MRGPARAATERMDYDASIHSSGLSIAAIGSLAIEQLWLPLIALVLVATAAIVIRLAFRRHKRATDV